MGKQKITFWNLIIVILITLSYILLALNSSRERPKSLTKREYFIGFFCTISGGLLYALYLAVVEKINKKVDCYEMVMEMQLVMEVTATALATVGMNTTSQEPVVPTNKNDEINIEEEDKNYEINIEEEEAESSEMDNKERQEELHATDQKFTKNKRYMLVLSYFLLVVVSTSSLLLSSQLGFNLVLSVIMGKKKITFWNLTTVIFITLSYILLALNSSRERPKNLTEREYFIGFFCTISGCLLYALYLAVVENINKKVDCYEMVMEMQMVMEVTATALDTVGMVFLDGFWDLKKEAKLVFDKEERIYWVLIGATTGSFLANVSKFEFLDLHNSSLREGVT
ncbi:hypothetical protein Ahy_B04g071491 [Arachis hypogaea]|uniref:Probable purine permease n=1 Tax=Arachis hypogaea TaxID=3818 RepID=A0A444ZKT4_ARAHY|nr:hypothetical protein Ahy_B04g071491 [Arachis hypogaea]